jgi:hypothetical protein
VAQLDSASVFGTEGWGFESLRAYFELFFKRGDVTPYYAVGKGRTSQRRKALRPTSCLDSAALLFAASLQTDPTDTRPTRRVAARKEPRFACSAEEDHFGLSLAILRVLAFNWDALCVTI